MGFWDNVLDGFRSGMMRKGPNYVAKQREQLQRERVQIVERAYRRVQSKYQPGPSDVQY